ncbi:MAG: DNA internalization-related competence protein ComEC/Rec2 [Eubacterium sp.]|nr:DNA internalization-related competence protein ComEC/Rec2 [Eubacterium sp.]
MADRYPCQAAALYVLGVLAYKGVAERQRAASGTGMCWLALFAAAVLFAAMFIRSFARREPTVQKKVRQAVLLLLAFGTGMARLYAVSDTLQRQSAGRRDGEAVSVQGRITKKQARKQQIQPFDLQEQPSFTENDQAIPWTVWLTDSYLKTSQGIQFCGDTIVYADLTSGEPVIGNTILFSGKTILWSKARNEGNFDERAYYENQGYSLKIYADKGSFQVVNNSTSRLRECLYRLQQRLVHVYEQDMPKEEAGALCAMLLGEKSLLSQEVRELYRRSGIAHILAISGIHISILGAAVFQLLRKIGVSYPASASVSMGLLLLFGAMAGMGISTARAVVMFGIYLGAMCCGRAYDSANALAVAAAGILLHNPRNLFLAGFQFSFAAVGGVLLGKEICRICMPKYRLTETMLVSLSMQMLTLPLTAWYYYEIPVYAVLLNLLVLPLVGAVLILGLFGGAFGLLAGGGLFVLPGGLFALLSKGLLYACTRLLGFFSSAGELFLDLPGALYVIGQPKVWQMAAYAFALGGCVWKLAGFGQRKKAVRLPKRSFLKAVFLSFAACLGLLFLRLPKQAQVVALDVGQGDGIYIHTSDGMDVMIDGGSTDVKQAGAYRILPFLKSQGVAGIDCWFLSHLDKDHISGFTEIAESGYPIGEVVLSAGVVRDGAYESLIELLGQQQIQIRYMQKGDILKKDTAQFVCLAPAENLCADDRNAQSLVLLYEDSGFRGFFSGDISKKEEQGLLAAYKLEPVTLYKAAHHGSSHSNAEELLAQLKPLVCVISCAKDNSYGHPGEDAVAHMSAYSGSVACTMDAGQVRILQKKGGGLVQEFQKTK